MSHALAAAGFLLALLAAGCGDAATNPAVEGFGADPRLIAGRWATTVPLIGGGEERLEAELVPAGGAFLGFFEFRRFGRFWRLAFSDGAWDGVRLTFTASVTDLGGERRTLTWEVNFAPAAGGTPDRLLLSTRPLAEGAGPGTVEYRRPQDLD